MAWYPLFAHARKISGIFCKLVQLWTSYTWWKVSESESETSSVGFMLCINSVGLFSRLLTALLSSVAFNCQRRS